MARWDLVGALLLAAAGFAWGVLSFGDGTIEWLRCGSVGAGMALVALRRGRWPLLGALVVAIGTAQWWLAPLARGAFSWSWGLVALGFTLAALATLLLPVAHRVGFVLVGLGLARLLLASPFDARWTPTYVLALAGAALLVARPPVAETPGVGAPLPD